MKVITISGHAQHGKDTTANILAYKLRADGKRVVITHYADLVKYICSKFFDWNGKKDERGRSLLQYVGTDVVRSVYPNYWVDFIVDMIRLFGENWDYVIIPDTRFPNEIEYLRDCVGDVVHLRVFRSGFESNLTEEQKNHPSETALDGYEPDWWIDNKNIDGNMYGAFDDLRAQLDVFIKEKLYGND